MSTEHDKLKHSKRLHKDHTAIEKQLKIAKAHGNPIDQPNRYNKHHAMDCGNPECYLCGNPRKTHKDKLTTQEKKMMQDLDTPTDKRSNGLKNGKEEI